MANRRVHRVAGAVAGGTRALIAARHQEPLHLAVEAVGGALAGSWAGTWPDVLEPAFHPNHRAFAHSWAAATGVLGGIDRALRRGALACRALADELAVARATEHRPLLRAVAWLLEMLLRFLAGVCHGLAPGYLSHLALDLTTPKRLPLRGLA